MKAVAAEEAFPAGDRERHNHAVTDLKFLVLWTNLNHLTHVLVAEDVALFHRRDDAAINVQVGTANGASSDLDDCVAGMLDLGIRNGLAPDVAFSMPR